MELWKTTPYFSVVSEEKDKKLIIRYTDGRKIWINEIKNQLLHECIIAKRKSIILKKYQISLFNECIQEQLICKKDNIYNIYTYKWVDIETTSTCNYACIYCPVAYYRRVPAVMDMGLFEKIIDQLEDINTVEFVTLNSYNEPTIDPYFDQRINRLCKSRLKLNLYTNGSKLTNEHIHLLKRKNNVCIFFNIPGLDADYYHKMTGGGDINPVLANIESCLEHDLDVQFVINGFGRETKYHTEEIKNKYAGRIKHPILPNYMTDRCGSLPDIGNHNIYIQGNLTGCDKVLNTLSISVDGMVFMCCNDYFHKTNLGNIKDKKISQIVASKEAMRQRGYIFGESEVPSDHICRYCIYMRLSKKMENKRYSYISLLGE